MGDDVTSPDEKPDFRSSHGRFTIPPLVDDRIERQRKWGLPESDTAPGDYIIELNLLFEGGMTLASRRLRGLYEDVIGKTRA